MSDPDPGHTPLISVVVRTYNRPERLRECLQSLAEQTFRDFNVVVVNDGGEDAEAIARDELDGLALQYIHNAQNLGRTPTLNVGIENAHGRYVAFLDDDDFARPHHLKTLAEAAQGGQRPVVYSDVVNVTFERDPQTQAWKRVREQLVYSFDFDRNNFLLANYIPINCLLIRRDCFDAVGPFDESLSVYEDWEFLIRLSRKFDFVHVAEVTGEYRRRDDNSNIVEKESYPRNEKIVKRRYREERDAIFDDIFKRIFQQNRELRERTGQLQHAIQQNQQLLRQLQEAQKTINQLQQQVIQLRQQSGS